MLKDKVKRNRDRNEAKDDAYDEPKVVKCEPSTPEGYFANLKSVSTRPCRHDPSKEMGTYLSRR